MFFTLRHFILLEFHMSVVDASWSCGGSCWQWAHFSTVAVQHCICTVRQEFELWQKKARLYRYVRRIWMQILRCKSSVCATELVASWRSLSLSIIYTVLEQLYFTVATSLFSYSCLATHELCLSAHSLERFGWSGLEKFIHPVASHRNIAVWAIVTCE
jgi:hypothetical protein